MKNKRKKNKVIEKIKLGKLDIPSCAKEQTIRFFLLAVAIFIVGLFLAVMTRSLFMILSSLFLTIVLSAMGYYRLYVLSHQGYTELNGICEKVEYTLSSKVGGKITKDVPKRYLIRVKDRLYSIPYYQHNLIITQGDRVRMYLKNKDDSFEWNGVYSPSVIYGYEIIPDKEDSE